MCARCRDCRSRGQQATSDDLQHSERATQDPQIDCERETRFRQPQGNGQAEHAALAHSNRNRSAKAAAGIYWANEVPPWREPILVLAMSATLVGSIFARLRRARLYYGGLQLKPPRGDSTYLRRLRPYHSTTPVTSGAWPTAMVMVSVNSLDLVHPYYAGLA